jgi:hypothetical protein
LSRQRAVREGALRRLARALCFASLLLPSRQGSELRMRRSHLLEQLPEATERRFWSRTGGVPGERCHLHKQRCSRVPHGWVVVCPLASTRPHVHHRRAGFLLDVARHLSSSPIGDLDLVRGSDDVRGYVLGHSIGNRAPAKPDARLHG